MFNANCTKLKHGFAKSINRRRSLTLRILKNLVLKFLVLKHIKLDKFFGRSKRLDKFYGRAMNSQNKSQCHSMCGGK